MGAITSPMFTGSTVGVMVAARIAIIIVAIRHCENNFLAVIKPRFANKKTTKGNSNVTPIQNMMRVTKLK